MHLKSIIFLILISLNVEIHAQPVPTFEENIPHLITFGKAADKGWGDDDFSQVFFFVVPQNNTKPIYIRVFDPECGGNIDEQKGDFNTTTLFSLYGGKGAISIEDARKTSPTGNYKSGNLLASKSFSVNEKYDKQWYIFGPFNPAEGELMPEYGGYIFKMVAEGISGDDGNLYNYFLSIDPDKNTPVEGGNAFTYEYSFRLHDDPQQVSHIYPYMDNKVISVKQQNFDWDNDGFIRIVSIAKQGEMIKASADNNWEGSEHKIVEEEKNTSLDIQFIKNKAKPAKSNNVVFYVTNQYGELLPFYTVPIGGIPRYKYQIAVKKAPVKK